MGALIVIFLTSIYIAYKIGAMVGYKRGGDRVMELMYNSNRKNYTPYSRKL